MDNSDLSGANRDGVSRRDFVAGTMAAAAALAVTGVARSQATAPAAAQRRIKVGQVGYGGRGSWISRFFQQHGGYEYTAVADYFPDRAAKAGTELSIEKRKCFSGLSGYKRMMDSGIEAAILEVPPCFLPLHAAAAVAAGLHVYMAKPVAVDVPGTLQVGALGPAATANKRVFHVDYQISTDPINIEVCKRLRGGIGTPQMIFSVGQSGGAGGVDPPLTANIESRLVSDIWLNDDAIGAGYVVNFDIHIIDAVIWAMGQRPVAAYGKGGRFRKEPHGDSLDTNFITYTMPDGLTWNHQSAIGPSHEWLKQGNLECSIQGSDGTAHLAYWRKAYLRGGPQHFGGGDVADLYAAGAKRNIASFHERVLAGNYANETAQRSVDCTLASILGRQAARRGGLLTMDELIKENRKLDLDLTGLKDS